MESSEEENGRRMSRMFVRGDEGLGCMEVGEYEVVGE